MTAGAQGAATPGPHPTERYGDAAAERTSTAPNTARGASRGVDCQTGRRLVSSRHSAPKKKSPNPTAAYPAVYRKTVRIADHRT